MPERTALTRPEAELKIRQFLEEAPLLKPLRLELAQGQGIADWSYLVPKTIHLRCRSNACRNLDSTTWRYDAERWPARVFRCANCERAETEFWLKAEVTNREHVEHPARKAATSAVKSMGRASGPELHELKVLKVGQWPVWEPHLPARVIKALGNHASLFKKGVGCLREGLGIGAAAYFRRVVEDEVGAILGVIERTARLEQDQATLDALNEAKESFSASERLRIAATRVPASLKPGGVNPFATLYAAFSGPVHGGSEEEALETAQSLYETVIFLFERLQAQQEAAEEYMRTLRERQQATAAAKSTRDAG